jgi:hypothetical protein
MSPRLGMSDLASEVGSWMRHLVICGGLALATCVTTTGAVPLGNGEFMFTVENDLMTSGAGAGAGGAQRRRVATVTAPCGARQMAPGDVSVTPQQPYRSSVFTIQFRCT